MESQSKITYQVKLIFNYLVGKLKFLHTLLPKKMQTGLLPGWNSHMFWTAFKSGGKRYYYDYYCKLKRPASYKPKIKVAPEYRLTEKDIQHFYEHGFIKPFRAFSNEEAEEIRNHLVDLATNKKSNIQKSDNYVFQKSTVFNVKDKMTEKEFKALTKRSNGSNRHLEDRTLFNLLRRPAIVERLAQLLGPDLLLWRSTFFPVRPRGKGSDWHQASTWLNSDWKNNILFPPNHEELFQVTFWIALTDTYKAKSCLTVASNSQWEIHPSVIYDNSDKASNVYGKSYGYLDYTVEEKDINYIEMKAGECVIFSERAVHGSTDNKTDEWRWGVNARVVRTDTKVYSEKMLKEGTGVAVHNISNIGLDAWKAVLLRGEDKYGYNRLIKDASEIIEEKIQF